jgi:hypothetical protein
VGRIYGIVLVQAVHLDGLALPNSAGRYSRTPVAEARQRGAERLTILADPNAAGFYERNGAARIGEAPSDAVPGRPLPLYELRLIPRGPS